MAYTKCPDCGEYVDSSLDTCPECGCPIDHSAPQTAQPITNHSNCATPSNQANRATLSNQANRESVQTASTKSTDSPQQPSTATQESNDYQTFSELFWSCQFYKIFNGHHFDLGQRTYEFGVFLWEMIVLTYHIIRGNFANFSGRASRREYWSFAFGLPLVMSILWFPIGVILCIVMVFEPRSFSLVLPFAGIIILLLFVIAIIPFIAVSIRRMHDTNHCGWWSCVPFACFFLLLKRSDDGENRYGYPNPATNYLD